VKKKDLSKVLKIGGFGTSISKGGEREIRKERLSCHACDIGNGTWSRTDAWIHYNETSQLPQKPLEAVAAHEEIWQLGLGAETKPPEGKKRTKYLNSAEGKRRKAARNHLGGGNQPLEQIKKSRR